MTRSGNVAAVVYLIDVQLLNLLTSFSKKNIIIWNLLIRTESKL